MISSSSIAVPSSVIFPSSCSSSAKVSRLVRHSSFSDLCFWLAIFSSSWLSFLQHYYQYSLLVLDAFGDEMNEVYDESDTAFPVVRIAGEDTFSFALGLFLKWMDQYSDSLVFFLNRVVTLTHFLH